MKYVLTKKDLLIKTIALATGFTIVLLGNMFFNFTPGRDTFFVWAGECLGCLAYTASVIISSDKTED